MTSRIFHCSRHRAWRHAQEVLRDMKLRNAVLDNKNNRIVVNDGWGFFRPPREMEILMYSDEDKVEISVNVETTVKMLDFGSSEYLEEELLHRLREKLD